MKILALPILALLLIYLQQNTPNPELLCQTTDTFWPTAYRKLVHDSLPQLAWSLIILYQLVPLEMKIGPFWMAVAIVCLFLLTTAVQVASQKFMKPYIEDSRRFQILQQLSETVDIEIPELPCDLGFLGVSFGLIVLMIYLMTVGRLARSWDQILWLALQLIPTLLFTNVTLHGQISGFTAGVISVVVLDYFGIGVR